MQITTARGMMGVLLAALCGCALDAELGVDDSADAAADTAVDEPSELDHLLVELDSSELDPSDQLDDPVTELSSVLRYNLVQQKSSHNSFQRHEALLDQLIYHRVRSLELDIHNGKGTASASRDWFVYHTYLIDDATSCHKLSHCLTDIRALDQAAPEHEVVTLWIDLKDGWDSTHQPADLDALLTGILGANSLITPRALMNACPTAQTLAQAVTGACAWPTLASMRGKYIVFLTGGGVGSGSKLAQYLGAAPHDRVAFVAPDLTSAGAIGANPDVIAYNMSASNRSLAPSVYSAGMIGRVWGINTSSDWSATVSARAHHIATDKINYHRDPWAVTHDSAGWPFRCQESCATLSPEPASVISMRINTGDIWSSADSFLLLGTPTPSLAHSLRAYVSTVNSHVDEWAKGCLMARQSTDPRAPYFAVCRPANNRKLRIQYRLSSGASTSAVDASITAPGTIAHDSVIYVRLDLNASATCATGFGSQDGVTWTRIGSQQCFSAPLAIEGLAASSHGSGTVTMLLGKVTRVAGTTQPLTRASFNAPVAVGSGASGSVYDGLMP